VLGHGLIVSPALPTKMTRKTRKNTAKDNHKCQTDKMQAGKKNNISADKNIT
jgi:hypothetical protein